MEIILTNHARKRIKERCGVRKSSADRVARLAMIRGIKRTETRGSVRKWLDEIKQKSPGDGTDVLVYSEKAFVFTAENVLVTVLPSPPELRRAIKANNMRLI